MPTITVLETVAKAPHAQPIGNVQGLYFAIVTDEKPPPSKRGCVNPSQLLLFLLLLTSVLLLWLLLFRSTNVLVTCLTNAPV